MVCQHCVVRHRHALRSRLTDNHACTTHTDDELVFAAGYYWEEAQPVTISANLTITGAGKGITIINNTLLELRFDGTFVMQELTLEFTEPAYSGLLAEAWQVE